MTIPAEFRLRVVTLVRDGKAKSDPGNVDLEIGDPERDALEWNLEVKRHP